MELSQEEYEAGLSTLATRVEMLDIKFNVDELRSKIEVINKRCREDGDMFSGMLLSHDEQIKKLQEIKDRI